MSVAIPEEYLVEHYPNRAERTADWWVHAIAIAAAVLGGVGLIAASLVTGRPGLTAAAALYAASLVAMLICSAAYNFCRICPARPFLRRLDEAGIFLLIAGSYTPFTTQRFEGGWAVGMTVTVWVLAIAGMAGKLVANNISERTWTMLYVALGWLSVVALEPMIRGVPMTALALLAIGGLLYTSGTLIFLNPKAPYRRAVWHGFVTVAAALHYVAVLTGVVLAP